MPLSVYRLRDNEIGVIAENPEDAMQVAREYFDGNVDPVEESRIEKMPDDWEIAIRIDCETCNQEATVKKTAAEWIAKQGRGLLYDENS